MFKKALEKAKGMKPMDITKGGERAMSGIHASMRRDNPRRK